MKIKRKKRLEEIDCPYIKECAFKDKGILYSCRKGGYTGCSIYLSNKKLEDEKEQEKK